MTHTITVGGLLLTLGLIAGLLMIAFGALETFAGGMSDDPEAGAAAGNQGCILGVLGIALFAFSLWELLT